MNLKDLFDHAENGTLTYDQFMTAAKAGKAKFVDLSEGNYVDKQKYTDDLSARDTRITTLDTDLTGLRQKLETAGVDAEKLKTLNASLAELQKKYDTDTQAYAKQLKDQSYKYSVNDYANKYQFTSKAAKRDFINAMLAKNFNVKDDAIEGADDFVTSYKKENSDAFAVEKNPTPGAESPKPHFVDTTTPGATPPAGESTPFQFNFAGVRPHPTGK